MEEDSRPAHKPPIVGSRVKVVYDDGPSNPLRSIQGVVVDVDDFCVAVESRRLTLTIGRAHIARIEQWAGEEGYERH